MKQRIFFYLVELYIVAAFFWWTYSLIRLSEDKYHKNIELLQRQTDEAYLQLMALADLGHFDSPKARVFTFHQAELRMDEQKVREYIQQYYPQLDIIITSESSLIKAFLIIVKPAEINYYVTERGKKQRMYIYEGVFFLLIISWGVIWVFRSFQSKIALNTQQNNFLLSVTHELKTPLAAAKLMLQTVVKRDLPREQQNQLLQNAVDNMDRLNDLVENMLIATQIEARKYVYEFGPVNLSAMLEDLAQQYMLKPASLVQVKTEIQHDIIIHGDATTLKLAFSNLIENAVKYSTHPAQIGIAVFPTVESIVVHIKDEGKGIPEAERDKVFTKFYRVGREETRNTKGTGLGLYIVEQVVKNHHARIRIRDNEPRGTIMEIEFTHKLV